MAMDKDAAEAYVYAKISGMLSKSFTGQKASKLFAVQTIKELWSVLFSEESPAVPEKLLARELEKKAEETFVSTYISLLSNYSNPDKVLVSLLHSFEYDNLKQIGASLCFNEEKLPEFVNIAPYGIINYDAWPNIEAMTQGTVFDWYNKIPALTEQQKNDARLDNQYINEVWKAVNALGSTSRAPVAKLLGLKFSLENVLWALRLKVYYKMDREEILSHLTFVENRKDRTDPVAGDAVEILDWTAEDYAQWEKWKYSELLNPYEETGLWTIDPRWVYNASRKMLVNRAQHMFHQFPFTACPLVCWYLIKENELDVIRTASECLKMGENQEKAMSLAGITEENNG